MAEDHGVASFEESLSKLDGVCQTFVLVVHDALGVGAVGTVFLVVVLRGQSKPIVDEPHCMAELVNHHGLLATEHQVMEEITLVIERISRKNSIDLIVLIGILEIDEREVRCQM